MKTQAALRLVSGKSRVRITDVDEFGYFGRDNPPHRADVGRMCTVEKIAEDDWGPPDGPEFVIVVAVPDGQPHRRLELIDHEIEESC